MRLIFGFGAKNFGHFTWGEDEIRVFHGNSEIKIGELTGTPPSWILEKVRLDFLFFTLVNHFRYISGEAMNALKRFIAMLLLALLSTTVFAITDNQLFAYAEATYPDIFTGTATAGQFRRGGQEYNYRLYKASGNYLAVDPAGVISIMGPYTGNKVVVVGPVSAFADFVAVWENRIANPAKEPVHDVGEAVFGGLTPPSIGKMVSQTSDSVTYQLLSPQGSVVGNVIVDKNGEITASERVDKAGKVIATVPESGPGFFVKGNPPKIVSREILDQAGRTVGWEYIGEDGTVTHHEIHLDHTGTYKLENGLFLRKDGSLLIKDR